MTYEDLYQHCQILRSRVISNLPERRELLDYDPEDA